MADSNETSSSTMQESCITEAGIFVGVSSGLILFCILSTCLIINALYSKKHKLDISIFLLCFFIIILISCGVAYYFFDKF